MKTLLPTSNIHCGLWLVHCGESVQIKWDELQKDELPGLEDYRILELNVMCKLISSKMQKSTDVIVHVVSKMRTSLYHQASSEDVSTPALSGPC